MKLLLYLSFGSFLLSTSFAAPIQDVSARSIETIGNMYLANPVLHRRRNDADADADADIVYPVADYRKLHLRQRQHEDADADVDIVYTAPREGSANSWAQRNSRQRRQDAVDADVDIVYTAPEEGTPNSRAFKPWSRRDDDSDADADADIVYTAPGGIKSGLWRIPPTV